jgi:ATP adenylyltransferase
MAQTGDAFAVLPVELFVGNVTPQHAVVLNKFPVLPEHCVIVTRAFRRQDEPLTQEDMRALWLWCVPG